MMHLQIDVHTCRNTIAETYSVLELPTVPSPNVQLCTYTWNAMMISCTYIQHIDITVHVAVNVRPAE